MNNKKEKYLLKVLHKSTFLNNQISLFLIVKDEIYFMPHFFEHYRKLGVKNFLVYDDGSTDGTLEYLTTQNDCMVVRSEEFSFGDVIGKRWNGQPKRFCSLLRESLPQRFFPNDWVITVDADEFMILPPGISNLSELVSILEKRNQYYTTAPMVDFYPERLVDRNHDYSISPFDSSPYFDRGPLYDWKPGLREPIRLWGGIRARLINLLNTKYPDLLIERIGPKFQRHWAKLWKVPLIKNGAGINRDADHQINISPDVSLNVALAHFKFYPGIDKKISNALSEGQYFNSSEEYRFLDIAIRLLGDDLLIADTTSKYDGPKSLVEAGHIQSFLK